MLPNVRRLLKYGRPVGSVLGCAEAPPPSFLDGKWSVVESRRGDTTVRRTPAGSAVGTADLVEEVRVGRLEGAEHEMFGSLGARALTAQGGVFLGDGSPGDFRLAFRHDSANGRTQLQYLAEGEAGEMAERLADADVWRPEGAALAEYAGTFASEELDARWRLVLRNGGLVLRRAGRADAPLSPIRRDLFTRHFGAWNDPIVATLAFHRDRAGQLTHFSVTTPPGADVVRDLRFVRQSSR